MTKPVTTLGHAARHGMLLRIECLHCGHVGHHKAIEIARLRGPGRRIAEQRFTCSCCTYKEVRVEAVEVHRDRPPKVDVWVPMRFRV